MKRILFVDHANRILGGAEINIVELLGSPRAKQSWTSGCACPRGSRLSEALEEVGVPSWDYTFGAALDQFRLVGRRFSLLAGLRGLGALRATRRTLARVIDDFRPEVVVTCTNKDHFCAAATCRQTRVPLIWWVNDIVSADFFPWAARAAFFWHAQRGPARLVTVSEFAREALRRAGLPSSLLTTIHNGISLTRYRRTERGSLRKQWNLSDSELLVGIVGRFTPWKGQEFFLRLAQAWIGQGRPGHFVLAGHAFNEEQAFEARLRSFVTEHGLTSRVHFVPFLPDIAAALSDLDVAVHTSLRPEPFGRVIIEAMAAEVPVIAARDGGVPEIVQHGLNGLLAVPGDLQDYLSQLTQLLSSASLRAKLGAAGRRIVEERFTLDRVCEGFDRVFAEVV
jgi:glycosyltransferase involved in cell wall biosynthesis